MERSLPFLLSGMLAAVPAIAPAAQEVRGLGDSTFTWSEHVDAGATLHVFNIHGAIRVSRGAGDLAEVRAEKYSRYSGRREDVGFVVLRDGRGGDVTICAVIPDQSECDQGRLHATHDDDSDVARVDFVVRLPRGVRLDAGTGNGEVTVQGATADVSAHSGNGRVRVGVGAAAVVASSGNGEVDVDDASGRVTARSGNGRVRVTTEGGPVSASSGNGDIEVQMAKVPDSDDLEFSTGNGRVSVTVPPSFEGEIETSQGHGTFSSDFPFTLEGHMDPHHVKGVIGRGGRRILMSSGNGDLELRKSR
jgi:hypothetical protein